MSRSTELSRPVTLDPWPSEPVESAFAATPRERAALARRFELEALGSLEARCRIDPLIRPDVLIVTGVIAAEVVQTCVVSLASVPGRVETAFERHLARPRALAELQPALVDPDAIEVEPLATSALDLGDLVAEELALALDPYPHAPDAYAAVSDLGPDVSFGEDVDRPRPFAALAPLAR